MKKTVLVGFFGALLLTAVLIAGVRTTDAKSERGRSSRQSIRIEGATPENSVVSLGEKVDKKSGELVQGFAIVHYAKEKGGMSLKSGSSRTACYSFLARGAKWKVLESWVVNPTNSQGLSESYLLSNIGSDIAKYEEAAGVNILGNGSLTYDPLVADEVAPDGKNEVLFGSVENPGAIAVTIVWGVFGGKISQRRLVEWDQVYDEVDFSWSQDASLEPGKMDFENIATHELGHSMGLGDLYMAECAQETMYGYATEGETIKRSLNSGDITGIRSLY